jgi:hypothetical protein
MELSHVSYLILVLIPIIILFIILVKIYNYIRKDIDNIVINMVIRFNLNRFNYIISILLIISSIIAIILVIFI